MFLNYFLFCDIIKWNDYNREVISFHEFKALKRGEKSGSSFGKSKDVF